MRRLASWLIGLLIGDRELDVEARYHPYYPGEGFDAERHDA